MDFIKEKIRVMTEKLESLTVLRQQALPFRWIACPQYKQTNTPPAPDAGWQDAVPDMRFGGVDTHFWLHTRIPAASAAEGTELRLSVRTGREGSWDATNPQFTVFLDGVTVQALDTNHTWLPVEAGQAHDVFLYLYTGMIGGLFDVSLSLQTADLRVESLWYDICVPYEALCELEPESYDYIRIRDCLDKALLRLDLRHVYSEDFYTGLRETAAYLRTEFYEGLCGGSKSIVSCIGHTHIDVAWLWTVAQTREKAQRSFATALNLMKRYPEFIFMSSQPQLYEHVKQADPELYARLKEAVARGQWEPEGAMWLEADTNLISGESLIRQILYGKRFMQEEFGVDCRVLWLPDVFGYSGALPQILKKCGVDRFFTAKMSWSETNKLPNTVFLWEGIDGSQVFASIIEGYVRKLDAKELKAAWDWNKNKSLTNRMLLTCGFGDGGGGTTFEMLEKYRRLRYGLPGLPKAEFRKAGDSLALQEADFRKNTAELHTLPRWKGEMYLEMHRGTYTSIAKNKKNNRKSELLYQKAETLAAADLALLGGAYPSETIRRNTVNILLNQFHDIIPGSSIRQVYDVTDREYAQILRDGQCIAEEKLAAIRRNLCTQGGIFVYNPAPFALDRYLELDGKTYRAAGVPAHGWAVIPAEPVDTGVTVRENTVENDLLRVTFNGCWHIVSVFDKQAGREVLSAGAEANRLEVYEDYPREYDAWEITDYYRQKMWLADGVESVRPLERGFRVRRRYQASTITQDILLTRGSKRIDFVTEIDWQEDHVLLKAAFPVDVQSMNATYDIQFGSLERPTHRSNSWDAAKFEVCAHKWADLSEAGYGVSLLNDCKYGYSIEDSVMRISLLKAATYPNPEADRGMNRFTYSLLPHTGGFREGGTIEEGYLLNMPADLSRVGRTDGPLPETFSLVTCPQKNIVVETIKKAEADDGIIVRFYDAYSCKSTAAVTPGFPFRAAYLCDMLENEQTRLEVRDGSVSVPVRNFEIVTLKFVR